MRERETDAVEGKSLGVNAECSRTALLTISISGKSVVTYGHGAHGHVDTCRKVDFQVFAWSGGGWCDGVFIIVFSHHNTIF